MKTEQQRIHSLKAVNGDIFTIGDKVLHSGAEKDSISEITGFYWDETLKEYRAQTTKGNACVDYMRNIK